MKANNLFLRQFPTDFQSVLPSLSLSKFISSGAGGYARFNLPLKSQTWVLTTEGEIGQSPQLALVQRNILAKSKKYLGRVFYMDFGAKMLV